MMDAEEIVKNGMDLFDIPPEDPDKWEKLAHSFAIVLAIKADKKNRESTQTKEPTQQELKKPAKRGRGRAQIIINNRGDTIDPDDLIVARRVRGAQAMFGISNESEAIRIVLEGVYGVNKRYADNQLKMIAQRIRRIKA